ncbi:MAG: hypothetical protein GFH27_549297n35 [Chloroflexi bacterium AL-W]|nr:hypothetical protein [Chloroflexi bacterium AL-W]
MMSFSTLWRVESYVALGIKNHKPPLTLFQYSVASRKLCSQIDVQDGTLVAIGFSTLWRVESYVALLLFREQTPHISFSTLWRVESYVADIQVKQSWKFADVSVLCGESKVM